jgi:hypothetical protein
MAKARCRRRTFHEPNLIDGLGTTEERRTNQLGIYTEKFGAAKVRHKFGRTCRIMREILGEFKILYILVI